MPRTTQRRRARATTRDADDFFRDLVGGGDVGPAEDLLARASDALTKLSAAELATLALVAEGRSNIAIAEVLIVSPRTVEDHVSSIFRKLGLHAEPEVHRRVLAAVIYLRSLG